MRTDKGKALKLRLTGKSYTEINRELGVPKATLSDWFSRLELSPSVNEKIWRRTKKRSLVGLLKRNKRQTTLAIQRRNEIRSRAAKEISSLSKRELFLIGLALYWAEGYKRPKIKNGRELTNHPVCLTNSDPYLVKLFLRFLREVCLVSEERIKAEIRIYQHQNEANLLNFWSVTTSIDKRRFGKTYYGISKSSLGKRPFNILPFGTILIRVNDTQLFHRVMGWIEGLKSKSSLKITMPR